MKDSSSENTQQGIRERPMNSEIKINQQKAYSTKEIESIKKNF